MMVKEKVAKKTKEEEERKGKKVPLIIEADSAHSNNKLEPESITNFKV